MSGGTKDNKKIVSLIIKLLQEGKTVLYNPQDEDGYDTKYLNLLVTNFNNLYKRSEMVYVPIFNNSKAPYSMNYFYKAEISLNQPILFRPSPFLIKFLHMFLSLEDLSAYLANGSYEFMSNTRVNYIVDKRGKDTFSTVFKSSKRAPSKIVHKTQTTNRYSGLEGGGRKRKTKKARDSLSHGFNRVRANYMDGLKSLYSKSK